jgi:uncharacterized FlaG/YvyC family protein
MKIENSNISSNLFDKKQNIEFFPDSKDGKNNFIDKVKQIDRIKELLRRIDKEINPLDLKVRFKYNDKINFMFIEIVNFKTEKVLKQIPDENFIKLKQVMTDMIELHLDELQKENSKLEKISFEIINNISNEKVKETEISLLSDMNETLSYVNDSLEFESKDDDILVISKDTNNVIGTLKSEHIKDFNFRLKEVIGIIGMIFDNKT